MELCIKTLTGVSLEILVSPFDTVFDVKCRIQKREGLLFVSFFNALLINHIQLKCIDSICMWCLQENKMAVVAESMNDGIDMLKNIVHFRDNLNAGGCGLV